jgi:putative peptidoglycan lipid II flippase
MQLTGGGISRVHGGVVGRAAAWARNFAGCVENRVAFRALFHVGPLVMLARLTAMAKAMMIARVFGPGSALDAFYIALLFPTGLMNMVCGSISSAFVPVYLDAKRNRGDEAAKRLYDSMFAVVTTLFLIGGGLLLVFSKPLFAVLSPSFNGSARALAMQLFVILAPATLLGCIPAVWTAVLNAEGRFTMPALSRLIAPLSCVAALLLAPRDWGIYSLAAGTMAGAVGEVGFLAFDLRRRGFKLTPRWHGLDGDMRSVVRQFVPGVTCSVWSSGSGLVDQSMASTLPSGSVASLNFGSGLVGSAIGVIADALGIVMLPSFSRLVAAGAWADVRRVLRTYVWLALAAGASVMAVLIALSRPVIGMLYQRGAFSAADTEAVSRIQIALALQIPAALAAVVILRLLAAMQRTWVRSLGGAANLVLNFFLNYWLMGRFGVSGIALSTSLVCILSTIFLGLFLRRELNAMERKTVRSGSLPAACAPVMADVN